MVISGKSVDEKEKSSVNRDNARQVLHDCQTNRHRLRHPVGHHAGYATDSGDATDADIDAENADGDALTARVYLQALQLPVAYSLLLLVSVLTRLWLQLMMPVLLMVISLWLLLLCLRVLYFRRRDFFQRQLGPLHHLSYLLHHLVLLRYRYRSRHLTDCVPRPRTPYPRPDVTIAHSIFRCWCKSTSKRSSSSPSPQPTSTSSPSPPQQKPSPKKAPQRPRNMQR